MNKKGFTLIEIIICIVLVGIIGTASFFGVKTVLKSIKIDKLSKIQDKILNAAEVYLETNDTAKTQLYTKKNAVVLPLNVLKNEGLLDLKGTQLDDKDIKNEYIVTALTGSSSNSEGCIDITTTTSWDETLTQPIYICTNSSGGSNLATINPESLSNYNKAKREIYYFKGAFPNNYAKYEDTSFRIASVDIDDSLTIVTDNNIYSEKLGYDNIIGGSGSKWKYPRQNKTIRKKCHQGVGDSENYYYLSTVSIDVDKGESVIDQSLYNNVTECNTVSFNNTKATILSVTDNSYLLESMASQFYITLVKTIHLKPIFKICSGTGAIDNPYILKKNSC